MKNTISEFKLGSGVVHLLIPHSRPFVMVDCVEGYERGPRPTLQTSRYISGNESIFEGHFDSLHLWPGVFTIEGMGQTSNLLVVFLAVEDALEQKGEDPSRMQEVLSNIDRGFNLHPGFKADKMREFSEIFGRPESYIGVSSGVDIKFLKPVFAGCRLDFFVTLTHQMDNQRRFEVEARVKGQTVARGKMTATLGFSAPRV